MNHLQKIFNRILIIFFTKFGRQKFLAKNWKLYVVELMYFSKCQTTIKPGFYRLNNLQKKNYFKSELIQTNFRQKTFWLPKDYLLAKFGLANM